MTQRYARQLLELVGGRATTKLPKYMFRRGDTYYFKRKIPMGATDAFPEYREQVWRSLDTTLLGTAKVRLAVEVTEFNLRLAEHRRKEASQVSEAFAEAFVRSPVLVAGTGQSPLLDAQPDRDIGAVNGRTGKRTLTHRLGTEQAQTSSKNRAAKTAGLGLRKVPPEKVGADGYEQTMLHLFEDWKRTQTRHRTINAVEAAVMEFRLLHGPIPVDCITRTMVRAYRDQLLARSLSQGTIENRIGFLSTLVRHGMNELVEHMTANPFERIEIVGAGRLRPSKKRRPYEVHELNRLFSSHVYTKGYRPRGQVGEAAYWLPLLGPFIGARIEELCQLTVADIQRVNGVWCLRICNLDEDQNIKTESSYRRVPLHEELIRCGFLQYVAKVAAEGHRRVFHTLSNENSNQIFSNAPGKWFGRYMDSIGLSDPRLDYHSFRYLFKQRCSLCGVESEARDALAGHWGDGAASRVYMRAEERQYPFPKLVEAIKQLRYDELRIEHLYVDDPYKGVSEHLAC